MAGKGIEIGIASETRAFKQGVDAGIIKPLDEAVDKLQELGDSRGPEELEKGLKDAQTASEKLQKETKRTADVIEQEYRTAYRQMSQSADQNMDRAREATRNFKDEARQNFAEVASSFDGSAQGIADGIQGTLGGAAISVGGAAGAALGALAIVGGAVGNAIATAVDEDAKASEERIQSMYDAFIESGLTYLTESQRIDAASALTGDPAKLAEFTKQAKELGVSVQDVILAQVSAGEERSAIQSRLNDQIATYNQQLADGTYTDGTRLTLLEGYLGQYQTLNGEQSKSTLAAELQRSIAEQITGQQKLTTEEIQKTNKALADTPKSLPVKLEVDSSAIDQALRQQRSLNVEVQLTRNGTRVY